MSKDEKRNIIVAIFLCIAAVIVIWLWGTKGGSIVVQSTPATPNPLAVATPAPSYVSYNIPPYNPAPSNFNFMAPNPVSTGGNSGCGWQTCSVQGNVQTTSVGMFGSMI